VWTLGLGSTYNFDAVRRVRRGDTITKAKAVEYLHNEVSNVVKQLNYYLKVDLNRVQSTAMVDYVYNRGIGNFLRTKLDELINADPNDPRIRAEILGTGLRDRAGNLLWGLGRRRRAEAHLYFHGVLKFDWQRWG
jgi:lysozyme